MIMSYSVFLSVITWSDWYPRWSDGSLAVIGWYYHPVIRWSDCNLVIQDDQIVLLRLSRLAVWWLQKRHHPTASNCWAASLAFTRSPIRPRVQNWHDSAAPALPIPNICHIPWLCKKSWWLKLQVSTALRGFWNFEHLLWVLLPQCRFKHWQV